MKTTQHLFIHDRREVFVLTLLVLMVTLFTFTLGVHLGKRVASRAFGLGIETTGTVNSLADQIPNRQELNEQANGAESVLQDILTQDLQNEVSRTGLQMAIKHQVDLPEKSKSLNAGATTLKSSGATPLKNAEMKEKYTLQIGSFPTLEEANKQLSALSQDDLKPIMREAEVKGKGKWYRLYLGGYPNRVAAEKAGAKYRSQHKISSFIIANMKD